MEAGALVARERLQRRGVRLEWFTVAWNVAEALVAIAAGLAAGSIALIGFLGNELAAQVRLRGGRRLSSPALIADGNHARVDGYVSLGVVASAIAVSLGAPIADPLIGVAITLVILKITWDSWRTVTTTEPGELIELNADEAR